MLKTPLDERQITRISSLSNRLRTAFEKKGYEVQFLRLATQSWEDYLPKPAKITELALELEKAVLSQGIDFFSIGTTRDPRNIPEILNLLSATTVTFCTAVVSDRSLSYEAAAASAALIRKLSKVYPDGFTNVRFAALFHPQPCTPFFPAAFHEGPAAFGIGLENSDLVYKAFSQAENLEEAKIMLRQTFLREYRKIARLAERLAAEENIRFTGIDASIAPSIHPRESIAFAFERLGLGKFGDAGTLAIAKIITETIQKLPLKTCGYSGLMLPVLEDYGLAKRNDEGAYDLTHLLCYSAVCGTGLDLIPLPEKVSKKKLTSLLLDIGSLSMKLKKPLSARLLPIPGKKVGEKTAFTFPYFVNTKIMDL